MTLLLILGILYILAAFWFGGFSWNHASVEAAICFGNHFKWYHQFLIDACFGICWPAVAVSIYLGNIQ